MQNKTKHKNQCKYCSHNGLLPFSSTGFLVSSAVDILGQIVLSAGRMWVERVVLCVLGLLAAVLASIHQMPVAPPPLCSVLTQTKLSPDFDKGPLGDKISPCRGPLMQHLTLIILQNIIVLFLIITLAIKMFIFSSLSLR